MPFQVGSLPIHSPYLMTFDISGLGNRLLNLLFRIIPKRPDLKDLNTLTFDPEAEIKFIAHMWRRAMLFHILANHPLVSLNFEFAKGHT